MGSNGRPSELGILEIADDAGNVIDKLNRLRLGPGLSLTRNDNDPSYVIDVIGNLLSSVVIVDNVASIRGMIIPPSVDKVYWTKNYSVSTDTGGMAYRWNSSDATTDDGVLHLKNSFHSTGRFQPIKPPDGMISAQACGPALADIGSIVRSFDPTGVYSMGNELKRISTLLRHAGWSGIEFCKDYNGNGTYKLSSAYVGTSTAPWTPFRLRSRDGSMFVSDSVDPAGIGIYFDTEIDILAGPYGSRYWTQTVAGGETVFSGVADITGLSVGDTMLVRVGRNPSDASGMPYCFFFGVIKTITPGSGTTGTIETWECVPEPPPLAYPLDNPGRLANKHDMVKVTGFQDNTTLDGIVIDRVGLPIIGYRNLTLDNLVWVKNTYTCVDGLIGTGLNVPKMTVQSSNAVPSPGNGSIFTLALQYDTHIGTLIVNDLSPRGLRDSQVITQESECRGLRIDYADITYNQIPGVSGATCQFCGSTAYQRELMSVGMLVVRGTGQLLAGNSAYFDCIDYKGKYGTQVPFVTSRTNTIIWLNQLFSKKRDMTQVSPIHPSSADSTLMANHGLTCGLTVRFSTMTGVTGVFINGDGNGATESDITSLITAGQWSQIFPAQLLLAFTPNSIGNNGLRIRVVTDGTVPAGSWFIAKHTAFEIDLTNPSLSTADVSAPTTIVTNGAPSVNSDFIGQPCLDSTNSVWYRSVSTGSGAADWISTSSKKIPSGASASGSVIFTEIAAPGAPGGSKIVMWADSTDGSIKSKDNFGFISVQPLITPAVAHKWLTGLNSQGSFGQSQISFADLWGGSEPALTDANATITVAGGSYYRLAASTLTGLKTLTLGNTSATDKQLIRIVVESQGSNYLINDSAAALLLSVASGTKVDAEFYWDTGSGKFKLLKWAFFT